MIHCREIGGNLDYFSHGFWSYIFFHRIKTPLLAVMFGLLPDTSSWAVYFIYNLIAGNKFGKPSLETIPDWVFTLYNVSHSIFVAFAAIAILYALLRKFPWYALAWPIAVFMDLLTHTREFLPTPFLWPVSDWRFPGISWGSKAFLLINYAAIALAFVAIYLSRKKVRRKAQDKALTPPSA